MDNHSRALTTVGMKGVLRLSIITLLFLSVPFMAMVFDWRFPDPGNPNPDRIDWSPFDFIIMGCLLFSMGFLYDWAKHKLPHGAPRIILATIVLVVFLLIWAELAVGIFNTPFAGS